MSENVQAVRRKTGLATNKNSSGPTVQQTHATCLVNTVIITVLTRNILRWPDTIYLHIGRLFSIQIFDHSAAFDCRDILDAEKEMLEVY